MRYRLVIGLTLLAAGLWSGWWLFGSTSQERAWEAWFADRRADGWQAEHAGLAVRGFPNRFDTEITAPALADPRAGWAWSAPWVRLFMLSYRPNHVIAELPPEQRVSFGGETVEVTSEALRASLRLEAGTALALERLSAEIVNLRLAARSGWTAAAPAASAHMALADPELAPPHTYDLHLSARDADLPVPLVRRLDPSGELATRVESLLFEGRVTFDAPFDRHAVEAGTLAVRALSVSAARLDWGDISVSGRGLLEIGPDGYPAGSIDITARGWKQMVSVSVASGMLDARTGDALSAALDLVALLTSGDRREIETALVFADGQMRIGPVPIGPAPRLVPPRS